MAQMSAAPADVAAELRQLEELLMSHARSDAARVASLLADDFVEIGASGRRWHKAAMVAALAAETTQPERTLHSFEARPLGDELWLALYRVTRAGEPPVTSWRSSLWRRQADGWRLVFHQGTLTATGD